LSRGGSAASDACEGKSSAVMHSKPTTAERSSLRSLAHTLKI